LDVERLSKQLGVPVVPIQANKGIGLDRLKVALAATVADGNGSGLGTRYSVLSTPRVPFPAAFATQVHHLHAHTGGSVAHFLARRLRLDVGDYTEKRVAECHHALAVDVQTARQRLGAAGCPVPGVEARARYGWIRQATAGCVERPKVRPVTWT